MVCPPFHSPERTRAGKFADVALNMPVGKSYQYAVPESMREVLSIGSIVRVPVKTRRINGCIIGFSGETKVKSLKKIEKILTPDFSITPELMSLARWISGYYFCSYGEALACVSFIGFKDCSKRKEKQVTVTDPSILDDPVRLDQLPRRQRDVMEHFREYHIQSARQSVITGGLNVSSSVIKALIKKGLVDVTESTVERKDEYGIPKAMLPPHELNESQAVAYHKILKTIKKQEYRTFLLYGVTGSGKTEIYLQSLEKTLNQGRQGIVLVPEIALTPQTVQRFRDRFGDKIGVYHSRLSLGQKYDMWRAIQAGRIQCLVGARSAVFTPFPNLGLIVVDEEHESTYKQNDVPRYHARDVAVMRASRADAAVILGSATPSLESYYNAQRGKFTMLGLPSRIRNAPMPSVELIDMGREIIEKKSSGIFSGRLEEGIRKRMELGEQVILFLNRRGFSNFLLCPTCKEVIKCKHCDVTMTYHKTGERLVCHYCGYTKKVPEKCPECGNEYMRLGIGTQRLEDELAEKFPDASIMRLDSDTLGSRKSFLEKWKAITKGDVDILFGTQILAKGFDLAPVTLVGVISADNSLFLPDFRSAERTFSLLTQVSGRAGRAHKPGEVIIQTYLPRHYSIVDALSQDYSIFAERELKNRRTLRFPPYFKLISILFSGKKPKIIKEHIKRFGNIMRLFRNRRYKRGVTVLGPAPSAIGKVGDRYRYRVLLRGQKISELHDLLELSFEKYHSLKLKGNCRISVDVDPQNLL